MYHKQERKMSKIPTRHFAGLKAMLVCGIVAFVLGVALGMACNYPREEKSGDCKAQGDPVVCMQSSTSTQSALTTTSAATSTFTKKPEVSPPKTKERSAKYRKRKVKASTPERPKRTGAFKVKIPAKDVA